MAYYYIKYFSLSNISEAPKSISKVFNIKVQVLLGRRSRYFNSSNDVKRGVILI